MFRKITALILSVSLIFAQPIFAQWAAELNIGKYLSQMPALNTDNFCPRACGISLTTSKAMILSCY